MKDLPFVSIIIPTRNVENIISRCLESLKKINYPKNKFEVIISDNDSSDKTPEIVKIYEYKYISTPQKSVCVGRNEGFKVARGELIAFSDADCVMDKNWIKNSIKYFEDPTVGGVGGPNITPDDETAFGKAIGFIFNQAIFSAGSIHGRILKQTKEVKSIPGCNVIYRRVALEKVMPMDKSLIEAEDYVMNHKIRGLGYRLVYTPDTIVWHYRRPSPKKFIKQIYRYAIGRLLIGKKDKKMINSVHIITGLGLPLFLLLSVLLLYIRPLWFIYLILVMALFLISYFFLALIKIKSLKSALFVPYALLLLIVGWSVGFLRELFFPVRDENKH